jgi:methylenetetrahydrofolate dehydrogenase (NADP+)/methenyltetrahydrofolate cyclohydrolase
MEKVKEDLKGEKVVIVNHSEVVGKPLAMVLLQSKTNAPTVCICHIATKDLAAQTSQADFLITAIGKANFFTAEYIKEGAIVIDVGINSVNGKIYGDVDLKSVYDKVSLITPVPGGVGELTLAYFFYNITLCLKKQGMLKETKQ